MPALPCGTAGIWEPTVNATVVTPTEYVGGIMTLCQERRGELTEHSVLGTSRTMLRYLSSVAPAERLVYSATHPCQCANLQNVES